MVITEIVVTIVVTALVGGTLATQTRKGAAAAAGAVPPATATPAIATAIALATARFRVRVVTLRRVKVVDAGRGLPTRGKAATVPLLVDVDGTFVPNRELAVDTEGKDLRRHSESCTS